jgi:3-oxoacyl-[acyl-carrier-protein] synthase-1
MKKTTHPEFCITGLGLTTSVGHDHKTACASMRAGLKRPDKLWNYYLPATTPFEDEDDGYVSGHPVLDGDYDNREERMVKLLAMAFDDLVQDAGGSISPEETPLYLALPEKERLMRDDQSILDLIRENTSIPFFEDRFQIFHHGHAGMIMALSHAAQAMKEGQFNRVFIAGTDSLIGFNDLSQIGRAHV